MNFYGKEYEMTDEITCDCGCVFKKDNCEIGISYSNKFLCEIHKPKKDLAKLKNDKIKEIKNKTGEIIHSFYPDYTQRNIDALRLNTETGISYTEQDKITMWDKIDNLRLQGANFQNEVNSIENIEDFNNFTYQFK